MTTRVSRVDPRSPFAVDLRDLGRRPGAMRKLSRTVPAPPDLGTEIIGVAEGVDLVVDLGLESVLDGVYVTGTVTAPTTGECVRCLDPVGGTLVAEVQELFLYDPPEQDDHQHPDEADELPLVDGDLIDTEPTLRDAIVTSLPFQPVCSPDCPGLCSRCGARLADDPDHTHDDTDPRWAALRSLTTTGSTDGSTTHPAETDKEP